jgi:hypothetical protein
VEARFYAPVQTGPEAHPSSYILETRSFRVVKRPGLGVNHLPPFSAEVKERVELYLYFPSGHSWPVLGRNLPLYFRFIVFMSDVYCFCYALRRIRSFCTSFFVLDLL